MGPWDCDYAGPSATRLLDAHAIHAEVAADSLPRHSPINTSNIRNPHELPHSKKYLIFSFC
jgi:hypothetical protein